MATTIVNPASNSNTSEGNGMGSLLGAIVLIALVVLFFVYGLPYIQGLNNGGTQINVPKDINVNMQQAK